MKSYEMKLTLIVLFSSVLFAQAPTGAAFGRLAPEQAVELPRQYPQYLDSTTAEVSRLQVAAWQCAARRALDHSVDCSAELAVWNAAFDRWSAALHKASEIDIAIRIATSDVERLWDAYRNCKTGSCRDELQAWLRAVNDLHVLKRRQAGIITYSCADGWMLVEASCYRYVDMDLRSWGIACTKSTIKPDQWLCSFRAKED